jgi:hypothetical protein
MSTIGVCGVEFEGETGVAGTLRRFLGKSGKIVSKFLIPRSYV